MRFVLLMATLLFASTSFAQSNKNSFIFIPVMCGGVQIDSKVDSFATRVRNKEYTFIRKKLFEGSDLEQILSAIILKQYHKDKVLKLSHKEFKKIRLVSNSKQKCTLCFTCTYRQQGTVKQLFHKRKFFVSYEIVRLYLFDLFYKNSDQ